MQRANILEKNRVIVRYWPGSSSLLSVNHTGSFVSFGHVSLQTFTGGVDDQGYYASFWRADVDKRCCSKKVDHIHTREEDVQYCGQAHVNNTFTLYSLDANAINAVFEDMIRHGLRWELRASLLHHNSDNAAVCSSLVYRLLAAGGLERLIKHKEHVLLGLPTTAIKTLIASTLAVAPVSTLLRNFIVKASYVTVKVHFYNTENGNSEITHHFFHAGWKGPFMRQAFLKKLFAGCRKFDVDFKSVFGSAGNLLYRMNKNIGSELCNAFLTATVAAAFAMLFISQRAATSYLIVKPADFPLLMKHAINVEQSFPRFKMGFFDKNMISEPAINARVSHRQTL